VRSLRRQEEGGKKAKEYATPGTPGKTLRKNEGNMVDLDAYRSIVGKIMYYATKIAPGICNAVRELAGRLSNPGEEHWKALERCVGYLTSEGKTPPCLRKPRELQSIPDCDSDYAKDENDRKRTDQHLRRHDNQLDFKEAKYCVIKQLRSIVPSIERVCTRISIHSEFGRVTNRKMKTRYHI
jgi:hypothetical protein